MKLQKLALAALVSVLSLPVLADEGSPVAPVGVAAGAGKVPGQSEGVATSPSQGVSGKEQLRNEQRKAAKSVRKAKKSAKAKDVKAQQEAAESRDKAGKDAADGKGAHGHHDARAQGEAAEKAAPRAAEATAPAPAPAN